MKKNITKPAEVKPLTAEKFADILGAAMGDSKLLMQLYLLFNKEMQKAVTKGRICTPGRMAILYPIFREINEETDENDRYWDRVERDIARRRVKKLQKQSA